MQNYLKTLLTCLICQRMILKTNAWLYLGGSKLCVTSLIGLRVDSTQGLVSLGTDLEIGGKCLRRYWKLAPKLCLLCMILLLSF